MDNVKQNYTNCASESVERCRCRFSPGATTSTCTLPCRNFKPNKVRRLSQSMVTEEGRIVRYHGPASFRHAPAASAEGLAWDRSSEPAITRARVWVRTRSRKELEGSEFARTAR